MSLIYSIIEFEKEFLCRIFFSPIRVYFTSFFSVVADQHPSFFFDSSLMVRSQRTFISSQWPIEPTLKEVSLFYTYNGRNLLHFFLFQNHLPLIPIDSNTTTTSQVQPILQQIHLKLYILTVVFRIFSSISLKRYFCSLAN